VSWDPRGLPSQVGKTVVVTGAGRGVGYFVAEQLAAAGARVILTTRGDTAALDSIRSRVPSASLELVTLELGSLTSIRSAAQRLADLGPIDVLVNNAGKTSGSRRREITDDGLEIMVGTNAYGPFALTALLLPSVTERVVNLGSLSTRLARAGLGDLEQSAGKYSVSRAYAYSKHAVHAFAFELDRRLRASGSDIRSILAHPGFALDGNASPRPGITDRSSSGQRVAERLMRPIAHGKDRGAWPVVRAATDPDAAGGEFYGPSRSVTGRPVLTKPVAQSADPAFGGEFWRLAERATGVSFSV
jgi:NAD(P)-dependent dehydrogenase (short-subunit alcohol dehydrogenase family)